MKTQTSRIGKNIQGKCFAGKSLQALLFILAIGMAKPALAGWECPYMVAAYNSLTTAGTYLQDAHRVFSGERVEAIQFVQTSQGYLVAALLERGCDRSQIKPASPVAPVAGSNCPYLEGAIPYLEQAIQDLNVARRVYGGLRYEADQYANAALDETYDGAELRGCYY